MALIASLKKIFAGKHALVIIILRSKTI